MPFCLSNVPSIWLIDDILRDFIGIFCNVYMDDIEIYSPNENSYLLHVEQVISVLEKGGMRISPYFLLNKILEFLRFVFSIKGIRIYPRKVNDILNFKAATTLRGLRSF